MAKLEEFNFYPQYKAVPIDRMYRLNRKYTETLKVVAPKMKCSRWVCLKGKWQPGD